MPTPTSTALSVTPTTGVAFQDYTFVVNVTPAIDGVAGLSGFPSGSHNVTIIGGTGQLVDDTLFPRTYFFQAVFTPTDPSFEVSESLEIEVVVNLANVTGTDNIGTPTVGVPLDITLQLTPVPPTVSNAEIDGSVDFFVDGNLEGSSGVLNNQAFFNYTFTTGGNHIVSYMYTDGQVNYNNTTITETVTANPIPSNLVLVATPEPSQAGQSVTFTATITTSGTAPVTGTVVFTIEGVMTSVAVTPTTPGNGRAVTHHTFAVDGSYNVLATYGGNATYIASQFDITHVVGLIPTSLALSSSVNPSVIVETVVFTATLTPSVAGTPTGTISFFDGATNIGTVAVVNGGPYCRPVL